MGTHRIYDVTIPINDVDADPVPSPVIYLGNASRLSVQSFGVTNDSEISYEVSNNGEDWVSLSTVALAEDAVVWYSLESTSKYFRFVITNDDVAPTDSTHALLVLGDAE